ncbi:MAG: hypothetical protein QT05_C0025G0004 [archaeon GW2011_AR13]|nr:MAG: hypothetical protein QT05_C0025G0004 [archaeon GW2011_AR13]HIG94460.1 hypothetical protein [Nanoarchaeota archaeon]HIH62970.1 hypothetical protein [Nanoarchaeota archaeon]HIJ10235.1 hypothetical protein [Nanoarchaeota archaeon]
MEEKLKVSKSELLIGQEQIKKWVEEKKRISKQKVNSLLKEIYGLKEFPESLKNEILKLRIKIIKEEQSYYSAKKSLPTILLNDKYVRSEKIDDLFEDELRDFIQRQYIHENRWRKKERNNNKIIKKYWGKKEEQIFKKDYLLRGNFNDIQRSSTAIFKKIIGERNYNSLKKELLKRLERGEEINGIGNASGYFLENKVMAFRKRYKPIKKSKKCIYCGKKFYPSLLSANLIKYYPIKKNVLEIDYCNACLTSAFWGIYKSKKSEKEMLIDIKKLIDCIGFIPTTNYFMNTRFLKDLPRDKFHEVMKILINTCPYSENQRAFNFPYKKTKEGYPTYKDKFGNWLRVLILAGVLEGYVRKTARGTFCIAEDGHLCLSMKEKAIDDWLSKNSFNHEKEPKYPRDEEFNPNQNMRGDWKVENYYIEYFGLAGSEDYDKKSEIKRKLCSKYKINLIEIHEKDISNLDKKLKVLLKNGNN